MIAWAGSSHCCGDKTTAGGKTGKRVGICNMRGRRSIDRMIINLVRIKSIDMELNTLWHVERALSHIISDRGVITCKGLISNSMVSTTNT